MVTTVLALHSNLQRLLGIRVIVFLCQLLVLAANLLFLKLPLPYLQMALIMLAFMAVNALLFYRLHLSWPVTETEFLLHLLMDVAGLSLLIYFTGGASNPFVSYLLVPVMIAAVTLPGLFTWLVALIALAAYTLLLFIFVPLPDLLPASHDMEGMSTGFNLHVLGMWVNFLVSAGLIIWFVVRMAAEMRRQQSQISALRETTLRNEQILAIATQAAGTAHELGTPLSTMAVILRDMELDKASSQHSDDIIVLQQQVDFCRSILQRLVGQADRGQVRQDSHVDAFLDGVLDRWQLLRPEVQLEVIRANGERHCVLDDADGLQQAIINLLNNAADAGGGKVSMCSEISTDSWRLSLTDRGPGITAETRQKLGLQVVSTKQSGMGVGFMLSHATLERCGGSVSMDDAPGGGTVTRIVLPVRSLI